MLHPLKKKQKTEVKCDDTNFFLPNEIVANDNSTTRTIPANDVSSRDLSIFTQHELHGLHRELSLLERLPSRNPYSSTLDHPPIHYGENMYNNRNHGSRLFGNYDRMPSTRQLEIMQLRDRVRSLEQLSTMASFPYRNADDETESLYRDSLEH